MSGYRVDGNQNKQKAFLTLGWRIGGFDTLPLPQHFGQIHDWLLSKLIFQVAFLTAIDMCVRRASETEVKTEDHNVAAPRNSAHFP